MKKIVFFDSKFNIRMDDKTNDMIDEIIDYYELEYNIRLSKSEVVRLCIKEVYRLKKNWRSENNGSGKVKTENK